MKVRVLSILVLVLFACSNRTKDKFSLIGKTVGIENGTTIYLDNADSQSVDLIDSTIVMNNTFVFNTELSNSPLHIVIRTNDDDYFRFAWLEDKPMTFDATKHNFENAIVKGSEEEILGQSLRLSLNGLSEDQQRLKEIEFIRKHPNSIVSAETLSVYATSYGKDTSTELFALLSQENQSSKYGEIIKNYIQTEEAPLVGEAYADFKMMDQNGQIRMLSDLKGKTILLEFWASWCAPCRKENPDLVNTYEEFKPLGFEIFAVSLDENKDNWLRAIKQDQLIWHHVNDFMGQANRAAMVYGVEGIPDSFLIDEHGIIVARDLRGVELRRKLEELLK